MNILDYIALLQALISLAFILGFVLIFTALRRYPRTVMEIDLEGMKGRVSIEDARVMIRERIGELSDEELRALRTFNNVRRAPAPWSAHDISPYVLDALLAHGLVKEDMDPETGRVTPRLALWGYRVLKNFLGEKSVHQPWEWLRPRVQERLRAAETAPARRSPLIAMR